METRNFMRSSAETILARAGLVDAFKNCCIQKKKYDGILRDDYF